MIVSHTNLNTLSMWYYNENMDMLFTCCTASSLEWLPTILSVFKNMTEVRKAFSVTDPEHDAIIHDDGED